MKLANLSPDALAKIRARRYDRIIEKHFVAVCEKVPGEEFFIASLYHEWFIIEND